MTLYPKLYKVDLNGIERAYWGEVVDGEYRTWSQRERRATPVASAWTRPRLTLKRTVDEQAHFEMTAIYAHRDRLGWAERMYKKPRASKPESTWYSPMLAQKYPHIQYKKPHWAQPKLDGVRCVGSREGLISRKNSIITSVPHIERQVRAYLEEHKSIDTLDGELYLHGLSLHEISGRARRRKPDNETFELQFHVFDCTTQWASETFTMRLGKLTGLTGDLHLVPTLWVEDDEDRDFLHARWLRQGYEGSIYRDPDERYHSKRTRALLKRKDFQEKEFRVVDIVEGNGAWRGCAKSIHYKDKRGEKFESGVRGSQAYLRQVLRDKSKYIGGLSTVRFFSLTPDRGVPYLPVTVNLGRWDV